MHHKTDIVFVYGNLTAKGYQEEILLPHVLPLTQEDRRLRLVQDVAPCHTARTTTCFLNEDRVGYLPWLTESPDLNIMIIENVWAEPELQIRCVFLFL